MIRAEDLTPEGDLSMFGETDAQLIYFMTDYVDDFMNASAIVIEYFEKEVFCCLEFKPYEIDFPQDRVGAVFVKEFERSEQF